MLKGVFADAHRSEVVGSAPLDGLAQRAVGDPAPPAAQHEVPVLGQSLHAPATDRDRYPGGIGRNVQADRRHGYAPSRDKPIRGVRPPTGSGLIWTVLRIIYTRTFIPCIPKIERANVDRL